MYSPRLTPRERATVAPPLAMIPDDTTAHNPSEEAGISKRFEVRSVTGACYTLIEEQGVDEASGDALRHYRTAYAGLPVVANEDGSYTIVDTRTRLVRVAAR